MEDAPMEADAASVSITMMAHTVNSVISKIFKAFVKPVFDAAFF
jgi:hypothetical protein